MRHPMQHEVEALNVMWRALIGMGFPPECRLLWSPPMRTYVIVVSYNARYAGRIPPWVTSTVSPVSALHPDIARLLPYGFNVPVVMVQDPPGAYTEPQAGLILGQQRPTLRHGFSFGFPAVSYNDAPVIDGVAYSGEDLSYCRSSNDPYFAFGRTANYPVPSLPLPCQQQLPGQP